MNKTSNHRISIVIPTRGDLDSLTRCMASLIQNSPPTLLLKSEVIIYVNLKNVTEKSNLISKEFQQVSTKFGAFRVIESPRFHTTAEESARNAAALATGLYLWIVGDQRVFYQNGLALLNSWVEDSTNNFAYFNSSWVTQNGEFLGISSTFSQKTEVKMTYKELVIRLGYNFMPTNFGAWIFKRELLDLEKWTEIENSCGSHFSHVAALLFGAKDIEVDYFATYLLQLPQKSYHRGDNSEWHYYAEFTNSLLYKPWTIGLVNQFNFLVLNRVMNYQDFQRAIITEAGSVKRLIDEVYRFTTLQIKYGYLNKNQDFSLNEFGEILKFVTLVCPERKLLNKNLEDLFNFRNNLKFQEFCSHADEILRQLEFDNSDIPLGSLIVGQIGSRYIRRHPYGYIASEVSDSKQFLNAYLLLDPELEQRFWLVVETIGELNSHGDKRVDFTSLIKPEILQRSHPAKFKLRFSLFIVELLLNNRIATNVARNLSPRQKSKIKKYLLI
jgi:hypothetical protein